MHKINDAIKCVSCSLILNSPVILPCGHSICKNHAHVWRYDQVWEMRKKSFGPSDGFPNNESHAAIIDTQFYAINLGEANENVRSACKSLELLINQVNAVLADPTYQTREEIDGMKNKIYLKREQLKLQIDQETDVLIERLDQYLNSFSSQLDGQELKQSLTNLIRQS